MPLSLSTHTSMYQLSKPWLPTQCQHLNEFRADLQSLQLYIAYPVASGTADQQSSNEEPKHPTPVPKTSPKSQTVKTLKPQILNPKPYTRKPGSSRTRSDRLQTA